MDIRQILELYINSDDEGRTKIMEDLEGSISDIEHARDELSEKNKNLQDMNRDLITRTTVAKVEEPVVEEKTPIQIDDLFDVQYSRTR